MYQMAGLTRSYVYCMGLQPASVIHNNLAGDAHHLLFHVQSTNQPTITSVELCHKKAGHPWFTETRVIRSQQFGDSTLNATQETKAARKHVKTTSFFLRKYRTLKFTYVIEYNRRPHSDKQPEWNEYELTKWNELQYIVCKPLLKVY